MSERNLKFPEGDQLTLELVALKDIPDPSNPLQLIQGPIDLTGATITLYRKALVTTPDNDPGVITSSGTVTDGPNGEYSVTITSAMLTPAGKYVYKIVAVKAGAPMTLLWGDLLARDT